MRKRNREKETRDRQRAAKALFSTVGKKRVSQNQAERADSPRAAHGGDASARSLLTESYFALKLNDRFRVISDSIRRGKCGYWVGFVGETEGPSLPAACSAR